MQKEPIHMEQEEIISKRRDGGFTLIELLIVIVILGILATVTVFAVRGITDKGQASACKADRKTIEVALEASMAQSPTAVYPATVSLIVPSLLRSDATVGAGAKFVYTPTAGAKDYTLAGAGACLNGAVDLSL